MEWAPDLGQILAARLGGTVGLPVPRRSRYFRPTLPQLTDPGRVLLSQLLEPMRPDPLTTVGDPGYLAALLAQPNLPPTIKAELPKLF
jgi:hypothetical protein